MKRLREMSSHISEGSLDNKEVVRPSCQNEKRLRLAENKFPSLVAACTLIPKSSPVTSESSFLLVISTCNPLFISFSFVLTAGSIYLYSSLFLIIVIGFFLFKKLNILSFFILALFVGVKLSIHYYVDEYIDSKKQLKKINHIHVFSITLLISLCITLPSILISKIMGIEHI